MNYKRISAIVLLCIGGIVGATGMRRELMPNPALVYQIGLWLIGGLLVQSGVTAWRRGRPLPKRWRESDPSGS